MNIDAIHKSGRKLISFVIPCYHSEGSVGLVIDEIRQVVSQRPDFTYQIIAVNDCSPDNLLSQRTHLRLPLCGRRLRRLY